LANFIDSVAYFAASCTTGGGFFGFPTWNKYLECDGSNDIVGFELNYIWLILLAVLEMLIYLAGMLAVVYFIYSGFIFMTSQGNPERVAAGRRGILNATIGLVIAILAANLVSFVVGVFQ